ncbi:TonB-dependent receptor [Novosphingobium sp.]|uniref:TonB-dependent receptor n=1 Tax=Novosphingobium sp. TaxID=1874826 RepID=UPI003342CEE5
MAPAPAPASDAAKTAPDAGNEILVTGFRASLNNALSNKRNATMVIESIVPEDIGKFPDQNVAESLQRLPGVQIDRSGGQGTAVLIDGLRQNLTTLNGEVFLTGREFYVSGEASGGGAGGNSQYGSLEGVPSEEIGGIDVYKNPQGSMVEGGVGGTINLKSLDPLAQKRGLTVAGNLRGSTSTGANSVTPVGTLLVSYKFAHDIGVFAALSYDDEKTTTNEYQAANRNQWLITDYLTTPTFGAATPPAEGGAQAIGPSSGLTPASFAHGGTFYTIPQLGYFTTNHDHRKIFGATFGVTARLDDHLKTSLVWFHSHERDESLSYSDKVWFNGQGAPAGTLASPGTALPSLLAGASNSIDGNGIVTKGTFYANGAETATLYQGTSTHADNLQWNLKFDNDAGLKMTWAAAYAHSGSDLEAAQADVEHGLYNAYPGVATNPTAPGCNNGASTCAGAGNPGYTFNWTNGGTSGLPTVAYNAPYADVLNNPAYTLFKSNWAWANLTTQTQWSTRYDASYDVNPGFTISAGARYAGRTVDQTFGRYLITSPDGSPIANCCQAPTGGNYVYYVDPGYAALPYSTATSNPALALQVNGFGVGPMLVKNPYVGGMTNPATYLNTLWTQAGNGGVANSSEKFFKDTLSSFRVSEKVLAGYLMTDIGQRTDNYHLNLGVRFTSTNLSIGNAQTAPVPSFYGSASWNGVNSNNIPVQTDRHYNSVLPSLNFTYKPSEHEVIRFGAARVVAPQDLFSLGLGNSYNFTRQTNARTNVNTGVKDGFAFAGGSSGNPYLDPYKAWQFVGGYENYFAHGALASVSAFYKKVDNFVEQANIATKVNDDFGGTVANVAQPINAGKGWIYGLELGAQYQVNDGALNGFGFAANYTYSKSKQDQATAFSATSEIPGVSKHALTGTAFYEAHGLSARLSYSWRSKAVNDSLVGSTFAFPDQFGNPKVYQVYTAPYGQLDGQIGYDFNKQFGVTLSAQNITKSSQHTYLQWPNQPFSYDNSGRRIFFGGKFKF